MIERVSGTDPHQPTVQVQYDQRYPDVTIGLEIPNRTEVPGDMHIIDALYGDVIGTIGENFLNRIDDEGWELRIKKDAPNTTVLDLDSEIQLGRVILDGVTGSRADVGPSGVWSRLDRGAVNRLIRLLRKARDSAFGRDE